MAYKVKDVKNPISRSLPQNKHFLGVIDNDDSLSEFDEQILNRLMVKRGSSVRIEASL